MNKGVRKEFHRYDVPIGTYVSINHTGTFVLAEFYDEAMSKVAGLEQSNLVMMNAISGLHEKIDGLQAEKRDLQSRLDAIASFSDRSTSETINICGRTYMINDVCSALNGESE